MKFGVVDVDLFSPNDSGLTEYAQRTMKIVTMDPVAGRFADSLSVDNLAIVIQGITDQIVKSYHGGIPAEQTAESIIQKAHKQLADSERMHDFARKVYDLIQQDERFSMIRGRLAHMHQAGSAILHAYLADFTVRQFDRGGTPEDTVEEFCSKLHEGWSEAEREALLRMPIEGTH